ncbi:unnamed protein product [Heterobilharzia americana]|nr:unnamed protein product [Heterobilharzia americana]
MTSNSLHLSLLSPSSSSSSLAENGMITTTHNFGMHKRRQHCQGQQSLNGILFLIILIYTLTIDSTNAFGNMGYWWMAMSRTDCFISETS